MNWTQPICEKCYDSRYPGRAPVCTALPYRDDNPKFCCDCGEKIQDGIYFRVDPRTVKFPVGETERDVI